MAVDAHVITASKGDVGVLETYLRGRGQVAGALVAAICVAAVLLGHVATARAFLWEANGAEPSAGEQLGLKPVGRTGASSPLTQTVTTSPNGDELFGFSDDEGLFDGQCRRSAGSGYLGFRRLDGPLRLLDRLSSLTTPPVIGGDREAVVVFTVNCKQQSILPFKGALERLQLLTGALGRRPPTTTVLSSTAEERLTAIAASPSGNLAVAWLAPHGHLGIGIPEPTDLLHLSIGRTSGSMSRPVVFGVDGVGPRMTFPFFTSVQLAWTGHHELLVAYAVNRLVMVQVWRPGHGLSRPQVLGSVNVQEDPNLTVAVGPAGRAVIAWGTQRDITEPRSAWQVYAAVRTAPTARFGIGHQLDGGAPRYVNDGIPDVNAQVDAEGYTTVAWSSQQRDSWPVRAAVVDPDGHFQPVQELAPDSGNLTLADAPGGGTVLQWQVPEGNEQFSLGQATRPPGGDSFAPAEASTLRLGVIDGAEVIDSATGG
jgi:hypothetical protein